jgi:hypothetical protein
MIEMQNIDLKNYNMARLKKGDCLGVEPDGRRRGKGEDNGEVNIIKGYYMCMKMAN